MITIGAPVARSFKTWPCSRKIGDPPVLVEFRGLVTEINPVTRKVHALFENGCTLVCPPSQMEPFLLKRNAPVSCAIPKYLKKILADSDDSDLSDSDEEQEDEKKEEDREEAEEKESGETEKDDSSIVYLGTKTVPDIEFVKVVPSPEKLTKM